YLPGQSTISPRAIDDAVNLLGRDSRQIPPAKGPLLPHQTPGLVPVRLLHRKPHLLSDFRDSLETVLHAAFAANLGFKHFPVVDAMLARLPCVADQDAAFQFVEIDAQLDAMLASRRELDPRRAAKCRRVVILRTCRNVDDDCLGVTADVNPIDLALPCPGVAVKGGTTGDSRGARAADSGAVGSFRIRSKLEAALRLKEFHDFRQKRQPVALGLHES